MKHFWQALIALIFLAPWPAAAVLFGSAGVGGGGSGETLITSNLMTSAANTLITTPYLYCPFNTVAVTVPANATNQITATDISHLVGGDTLDDDGGFFPTGIGITQITGSGPYTLTLNENVANPPSSATVSMPMIQPPPPVAPSFFFASGSSLQPQPAMDVAGSLATFGTTSTTSSQITSVGSTTGLSNGEYIFGSNIPTGAQIGSISGSTVNIVVGGTATDAVGAGTASVYFSPLQPLIEQYHTAAGPITSTTNQSYGTVNGYGITNPLPLCTTGGKGNAGWNAAGTYTGTGACRYPDATYSQFGSDSLHPGGPFVSSVGPVWQAGDTFLVDPAVYVSDYNFPYIGPTEEGYCYANATFSTGATNITFPNGCDSVAALGDYVLDEPNPQQLLSFQTYITSINNNPTPCGATDCIGISHATLGSSSGTDSIYFFRPSLNITVQGVTTTIGGVPTRPAILMDSIGVGSQTNTAGGGAGNGAIVLVGSAAPGPTTNLTWRNIDVGIPPCTYNCQSGYPWSWATSGAPQPGNSGVFNIIGPISGTTTIAQSRIWGGSNVYAATYGGITGLHSANDDLVQQILQLGTLNADQDILFDNGNPVNGPQHDIYLGISDNATFNLSNSWFYGVEGGHLVKSRFGTNNLIGDYFNGGTPVDGWPLPANDYYQNTYDVDFPCAGVITIKDSIFTKGFGTNTPLISYGEELLQGICQRGGVNAQNTVVTIYGDKEFATNTVNVRNNTFLDFVPSGDGFHQNGYFVFNAPDWENQNGLNVTCTGATIYANDNIIDYGTSTCLAASILNTYPDPGPGGGGVAAGVTDTTTSGSFPVGAYVTVGIMYESGNNREYGYPGGIPNQVMTSNQGRSCPLTHYCQMVSANALSASAGGGDTIVLAPSLNVLPPQDNTFITSFNFKDNVISGFCPASSWGLTGPAATHINWPWYGTQRAQDQPNLIVAPTELTQTYGLSGTKYTTPDGSGIVGTTSYGHQVVSGLTRALPTIGAVD